MDPAFPAFSPPRASQLSSLSANSPGKAGAHEFEVARVRVTEATLALVSSHRQSSSL